MNDVLDELKKTWKTADTLLESDDSLAVKDIEHAISSESIGITEKLTTTVVCGLFVLGVDLGMLAYSAFFYANNPLLLTLILISLGVCFGFAIFDWSQLERLKKLDLNDLNLHDILVRKTGYLEKSFVWVIQGLCVGVALIPFCVNLIQEREDGVFGFKTPIYLICFYVLAYGLTWILARLPIRVYSKQMKNALSNLEKNTYVSMEEELKRHKKSMALVAIFLAALTVLGVIAMLAFFL